MGTAPLWDTANMGRVPPRDTANMGTVPLVPWFQMNQQGQSPSALRDSPQVRYVTVPKFAT